MAGPRKGDPTRDRQPIRLVGVWRPIVLHDVWWTYQPVYPAVSNFHGGYILNPVDGSGQGLAKPEPLYVSIVGPQGPLALEENEDTVKLQPGAVFNVPPQVSVWVYSAQSGHCFTAVFGQFAHRKGDNSPVPPGSIINGQPWPVTKTTGLTAVLYAYLYQEYSDDDDLQEFVKVLNAMQQDYVDTFNALQLPVYPNAIIEGELADWTMRGIYGWPRPVFYTEKARAVGPLNTYWPNFAPAPGFWGLNMVRHVEPSGALVADDDLYKRTLTWHFQKGDGKYFNVRWLKRRIMRFMIGEDGTTPHIDQTNRISITFGPHYGVTIRLINHQMTVTAGAIPNMFGCNGLLPGKPPQPNPVPPNSIVFEYEEFQKLPYEDRLQEAIDAGVLELPFQFTFDVVIG